MAERSQQAFLLGKIAGAHRGRGNVAQPHRVATAARVVCRLVAAQLPALLKAALYAGKLLGRGAARMPNEEYAPRYRVVVVVETSVYAAQKGRPLVHGQPQANAEEVEPGVAVLIENPIKGQE